MLDDLDLTERKDLPIHKLSGGQLKRVSIGVELLTKPRLFFLDEPTSGLDPGTEYNMMKLLRRLADQGRTIVLITHATKNVMMCDKVIFLVRGGYVAFYGPPEEALVYFDRYRTDQERREKDMEFDNIYIVLEDDKRGSPKEWSERYQQSPEYQKYVVQRLQQRKQAAPTPGRWRRAAALRRRSPAAAARRVSALRQLIILSARNLNILGRDKLSLALMLLLAPGIGLMDFMWKPTMFDPVEGEPTTIITMLFMAGLITILTGALSSVLQIVKETDIYKRERTVGLKIGPYILSKVWIGVILALYQAFVFLLFKIDLCPPRAAWDRVLSGHLLHPLPGHPVRLPVWPDHLGWRAQPERRHPAGHRRPGAPVPLRRRPPAARPDPRRRADQRRCLHPLGIRGDGQHHRLWRSTGRRSLLGRPTPGDAQMARRAGKHMLKKSDAEKRAAGCQCMGSAIFETCTKFPGILSDEFYDDNAKAELARAAPVEPVKPPHPILHPHPILRLRPCLSRATRPRWRSTWTTAGTRATKYQAVGQAAGR